MSLESNLSKIISITGIVYSSRNLYLTAKNIYNNPLKIQALQSNLTPLIHTALGLSFCALGASSGNLSLSINGALQIANQLLSKQYFNHQKTKLEEDRIDIAKRLSVPLQLRGCCAGSELSPNSRQDISNPNRIKMCKKFYAARLDAYKKDIQESSHTATKKSSLINQATNIFSKLDQSNLKDFNNYTQNPKLTPEEHKIYQEIIKKYPPESISPELSFQERQLFKEYGAPMVNTSSQPIQFSGRILDIFELKKDIDPNQVIFPKTGETSNKYGRFLEKTETITGHTKNADGKEELTDFKVNDSIKQNTLITNQDKQYLIRIIPTETKAGKSVYGNDALDALQNKKIQWDLSTTFAALSFSALIGTIALATPFFHFKQHQNILTSLTKATGLASEISGILMPCVMNAADMRGYIAHKLEKNNNIIIKNEHLLDNLAQMNIDKPNSHYHFLIDFNGTLTKGSQFSTLKTADKKNIPQDKLKEIIEPIISLGEQANNTHHIHLALKEKFPELVKNNSDISSKYITNIMGQGSFYKNENHLYAIGNEKLIHAALDTYTTDNLSLKDSLLNQLEELKSNISSNNNTYILYDNQIYMLETTSKLRDDAQQFLKQHEGHFTILTGSSIPEKIKNQLNIPNKAILENLEPNDKQTQAQKIMSNHHLTNQQIIAFGDGGNDWGMFHTVNVAIQLMETNLDSSINFANAFSDVIIKELSDFDILNKVAQSGSTIHNRLQYTGLAFSMGTEILMNLFHKASHSPFVHSLHHLSSQLAFNLTAQYLSQKVINISQPN